MGKSDVKVINLKNLKLDDSDADSYISDNSSLKGGKKQNMFEESSEKWDEEQSENNSWIDEEEPFQEQEEKQGEELEQDDELDEFLDPEPASGGFDDSLFEDDNEHGEDEQIENFEEFEGQHAGRLARKYPPPPSISDSLIEELSKDPMLIVLTRFLISKKGNNIADILEEIKDHLAFIRAHIALQSKS
jgi:hypothetical protein